MPDYQLAAERAARKYGINPRIFKALIRQESGFQTGRTSDAGAQGIAQFIPSTAKAYGVNLGDGRVSDDLDGAARFFRDNLKRFGGDVSKALAAYNAGPGAVEKYGGIPPYAETQHYVRTILGGAKTEKLTEGGRSPSSSSLPSSTDPPVETQPAQLAPLPTQTQDLSGLLSQRKTVPVSAPAAPAHSARSTLPRGYQAPSGGSPVAKGQSLDAMLQMNPMPTDLPEAPDASEATPESGSQPKASGKGKAGGRLLELFYNGPGGVNVDEGKRVGKGFVSGHTDHVHVAAGPKTIQALAELAQKYGLTVRELAPYDKVDPVHTGGSFHYRGQALDASGAPEDMARYSRAVAKLFGIRGR